MFFTAEFAHAGRELPETPRASLGTSSKGYPETAPETPRGILNPDLDEASLRRLRQRYARTPQGL